MEGDGANCSKWVWRAALRSSPVSRIAALAERVARAVLDGWRGCMTIDSVRVVMLSVLVLVSVLIVSSLLRSLVYPTVVSHGQASAHPFTASWERNG